ARPGFNAWATDVLPALLESDVPFYSHEIDAYWNDIGNLEELRRSNLDAVCGEVELDPAVPERFHRVRAGERPDLSAVEIEPPVVFGTGVQVASGVRIEGPAVIGDGVNIGRGARV